MLAIDKRVVVVAGGELCRQDLSRIELTDQIIAVDGGAASLLEAGICPHHVVGDFDTLDKKCHAQLRQLGVSIHPLPEEKDLTDTQFAVELACEQEMDELILLGGLGGVRFDHALANLYLLESIACRGRVATLYYGSNRVQFYTGPVYITVTKGSFHYLSLIPVSSVVTGVSNRGLKYSLNQATLYRYDTRGVSNEWVEQVAEISWQSGSCFVIESDDQS